MHRKIATTLLVLLAISVPVAWVLPARSQETRPATRPANLDRLLRDLGADAFADRERAQRDLIALGPAARPEVERLAKTSNDPEVRSRAAGVAEAIARDQKFGQTRVTLHLKDVNPREAFDALASAGGATLLYEPADRSQQKDQKPVSVDADGEPFWAVFLRLCDRTGSELREWGDDGRLILHPGHESPGYPGSFGGPFAVRAHALKYVDERSVELDGARRDGHRSLEVRLQYFAEPKVSLAATADRATLTEATDDRGRSLLLAADRGAGRMAPRTAITWSGDLQLDPEAAVGATSIKTLRGTLRVELAGETVPLAILNPSAGMTADAAGLTLSVDQLTTLDADATLTLTVLHPEGDPAAQEMVQNVGLYDAAGRRLSRTDLHRDEDHGTLSATLRYRREKGVGPPAKLLWELPAQRRPVDIPFEFHDLPLP